MMTGFPSPTGVTMIEPLCNITISKDNGDFMAKVQTELGGLREYAGESFEELLEQLFLDLQEEFETF
jgi:hypothetical protein